MRAHRKIKIIILLLGAIVLIKWLFPLYVVSGPSMEPTLQDGGYHIGSRIKTNLAVDDIVTIKIPDQNKTGIKRIVGVPGDKLEIVDGTLYRNGSAISGYEYINETGLLEVKYTVRPDQYFVLGDNINQSLDSRELGAIKKEDIKAKILFAYS